MDTKLETHRYQYKLGACEPRKTNYVNGATNHHHRRRRKRITGKLPAWKVMESHLFPLSKC